MRSKIAAGTTSFSSPIYVTNSSTGAGLGSLVFNTGSLVAAYRRQGVSSWTTFSLSAGTLGTWSSGGWIADNPSVAGSYEVGIPNAAIASGVAWAEVAYYGAANMNPVFLYLELDVVNYQDGVHFGLTGIPNAAAGAANGLHINGANTGPLSVTGGVTYSNSVGDAFVLTSSGGNGSGIHATSNGTGSAILAATIQGDLGGRVLGNTSTAFAGPMGLLTGPLKINSASGFSFPMVLSIDHATPYTGAVTGTVSIAGGTPTAVGGTISQVGTSNIFYFAGAAGDFNGASVVFTFSGIGADNFVASINTTP